MGDINLSEDKNEILGDLDHLNSFVGLAKAFAKDRKIKKLLTSIQNDLFVIQANIAAPENVLNLPENIALHRIIALQQETHEVERSLKKIRNFILPEGNIVACIMHCVRTTARQVERKISNYLTTPTNVAMYLDRVACLMFALARQINQRSGLLERPPDYVHRTHERSKKWAKSQTRKTSIS